MTPRSATRLALAVVGACVALTLVSLILVGPIPGAADIARALSDLAYRLHPIAMAPLGALVVSRQPFTTTLPPLESSATSSRSLPMHTAISWSSGR